MPKVIDNYILQQKIGAGQFGDVFKGYHQQTGQEVAIKTIRRQTIKGKFHELLQNQIKVLKTCDNPNIIKLYAIKKTANHFYLMLQYCNQGDMLGYVRKLGSVPEEKAIKFFCQILNGFQDLVKYKIMHRDFKLANILLHDGNIKIADFGFAKLLSSQDYATTMLGSPLNMAPQVLGGNKYNAKADIWSIGACLWEMLYGKPPYVAGNMVDLLNMIKTKPLNFPHNPKINQTLKDVIKRMLVFDSKRRISWNDLFNHPINSYLAHKLQKQINLQLVQDESLIMNTSKFYLKKNLVIDNAEDLHQHEKMNQYLYKVIKDGKKKEQFKAGPNTSRSQKTNTTVQQQSQKQKPQKIQRAVSKIQNQPQPKKIAKQKVSQSSLQISYKSNMRKIMHFRNIYVFLATVYDQMSKPVCFQNLDISYNQSEVTSYLLMQKIMGMIKWIMSAISSKECGIEGLQNWNAFKDSVQLKQLYDHVAKQLDIFIVFNQQIQPVIKKGFLNGQYGPEVKSVLSNKFSQAQYKQSLKKYIKSIARQITLKMLALKKIQIFRPSLKHLQFCLIAYDTEKVFGRKQFNFKQFYDSYGNKSAEESLQRIEKMIKQL